MTEIMSRIDFPCFEKLGVNSEQILDEFYENFVDIDSVEDFDQDSIDNDPNFSDIDLDTAMEFELTSSSSSSISNHCSQDEELKDVFVQDLCENKSHLPTHLLTRIFEQCDIKTLSVLGAHGSQAFSIWKDDYIWRNKCAQTGVSMEGGCRDDYWWNKLIENNARRQSRNTGDPLLFTTFPMGEQYKVLSFFPFSNGCVAFLVNNPKNYAMEVLFYSTSKIPNVDRRSMCGPQQSHLNIRHGLPTLNEVTYGPREGSYLHQTDSRKVPVLLSAKETLVSSRWMIHTRNYSKIIDWVTGEEYPIEIKPKNPLFHGRVLEPTLLRFYASYTPKNPEGQFALVFGLEDCSKLVCVIDKYGNIIYEDNVQGYLFSFKFEDGIVTKYVSCQYVGSSCLLSVKDVKTAKVVTGYSLKDTVTNVYFLDGEIYVTSMTSHGTSVDILGSDSNYKKICDAFNPETIKPVVFGGNFFTWNFKHGYLVEEKMVPFPKNVNTFRYTTHIIALGKNPKFSYEDYNTVQQEEGFLFQTEKGYYTLVEL